MKVLAINGSARKDDNTAILIRYMFGELETSSSAGADNRIQLADKLATLPTPAGIR